MRKFLAVVKHEYKKVVLKWTFLISTLLLPFLAACFAIVPALIFSIKGEPTRIAVVDPTGKIFARLEKNLSPDRLAEKARKAAERSLKEISTAQPAQSVKDEQLKNSAVGILQEFILTAIPLNGQSTEELRRDLLRRIINDEFDAFLLIPENISAPEAKFEFRSRKGSDIVGKDTFTEALNNAVRSQRLADADISEAKLAELVGKVNLDAKGIDETGAERDTSAIFAASFAIGLMIYIVLAIYGQAIMGAVVEEKETRISEILFSSARPFELMMGKLVGVGLAGLTQLAIWVLTVALLMAFISIQADLRPFVESVPAITPLMIIYFLVFFLLGFFIYASIFALIGSMVTSVQEGSQFAFPPIMLLLAGFYFIFVVIRDPGSQLSFWVSIAPFFAPITMPVRILAETPPFWQIGLSILVNLAAIAGLVWVASRVYRVGMLMYGKRATLAEVWKWIRYA